MSTLYPLIFLHGWKGKSASWDKNIPYFESLGYSCFAVKLPGFDLPEPKTAFGVEEYAKYVLEHLDSLLKKHGKFVWIGHSFGGRLATYISIHHPDVVHKLILSDSAGINIEHPLPRKLLIYLSAHIVHLEKIFPFVKRVKKLAKYFIGSTDYQEASPIMKQTLKKVVNLDLRIQLHKIKCPTLVIWGEVDDVTPIRMAHVFTSEISDSKLEIISGAGHHAHKTHSNEWNKLVKNFV